jgi:type I restriction enzyme R subunit
VRCPRLEILGRYVIAQRDKKKQIERVLFPCYHQLDMMCGRHVL